jgi:hypothetical protein
MANGGSSPHIAWACDLTTLPLLPGQRVRYYPGSSPEAYVELAVDSIEVGETIVIARIVGDPERLVRVPLSRLRAEPADSR